MGKQIYAVVGDLGGASEVVPSAQELAKRGHAVSYLLDPSPKAKAGSVLEAAKVKYETRGPVAEDNPDVIVIGTSATANGTQVEFTKLGNERNTPVIWVEDLYGTGERKQLHGINPDAMCVIDPIAEQVAKNVRPNLTTHVVGKPSFETLPALIARKAEVRKAVRAALNVGENDFFVPWLFGGDPAERSWSQLNQFAAADVDKVLYGEVNFGLRFHPKHPDFDKQIEFAGALGLKTIDTRPIKDAKQLILAADLVFADWGNTDAVTSLLGHVPVATLLFPDDTQRLRDAGYINGVPPILMNWAYYGMRDVDDMLYNLDDARGNGELVTNETVQRAENFEQLLVPGAAARIADVVEKYLQ